MKENKSVIKLFAGYLLFVLFVSVFNIYTKYVIKIGVDYDEIISVIFITINVICLGMLILLSPFHKKDEGVIDNLEFDESFESMPDLEPVDELFGYQENDKLNPLVDLKDVKFSPDIEFIDFAEWFSKNYKMLQAGNYFSINHNYKISYYDRVDVNGRKLTMASSVGHTSKTIVFNTEMRDIEYITKDFVYAQIVWCAAKIDMFISFAEVKLNTVYKYSNTEFLADYASFKHCSIIGKDTKEIFNSWMEVLKNNPISNNTIRAKYLSQLNIQSKIDFATTKAN